MLDNSEQLRYSRHLLLPEVGTQGQERLKSAAVLVVGAGGLGSPIILYLAAAGVGSIGIVDFDRVDLSNLQRQIIYRTDDVDASKAEQAARQALAINPHIKVNTHCVRLSAENALDIISQYDLVVDGTDNFATRYLVNDACVLLRKPNVYGSIYRFEGQASVFSLKQGPCYRCLFPEPPPQDAVPNCAEGGVLGVMAGVIGCIQATEALKIILGMDETLSGRLLVYDALSMRFESFPITKNFACPVCGKSPTIKQLNDVPEYCHSDAAPNERLSLTATELNDQLTSGRKIILLDVRTLQEVALCRIENSKHIPLSELPNRLNELDKNTETVVYCKGGARSQQAVELLVGQGFLNVRNLKGGILAWAHDVDNGMATY